MSGVRILATIVLFAASTSLGAQTPVTTPTPTLAGTWAPSDPARSDELFNVGLAPLPGDGRLTIEQRVDRLTVTMTMPDEKLDQVLDISGRFYPVVTYRVPAVRRSPVGFGAGGPQTLTEPVWFGDSLVVPNPRPAARPTTTTYSVDGDVLKAVTRIEIGGGRSNTVTEWFKRAQ